MEHKNNIEMPELILITGGICAGKTTIRRNNFAEGYTHIDASDIFLELCNDEFMDFPSIHEKEMSRIGKDKTRKALHNKVNIVVELIGDDEQILLAILSTAKEIGYETKILGVTCDIEVAIARNANRTTDDVSAYYTQEYHVDWLMSALRKQK